MKQFCSELGIPGVSVSKELKGLFSQLDDVYENIVQKASSLDRAYRFYQDYVEYFFTRSDLDATCLPMLGYLIKKGNTSVYEWRTGVQPKYVEKAQDVTYQFGDDEAENNDAAEEDKIDFGDFEVDANTAAAATEGEEIDWGDMSAEVDLGEQVDLANEVEYDLDKLSSQICVESTGVYIPTDGVAKGNDAFCTLEWAETRNLLLNDLIKLDSFLKHKYNEMRSESDNLLISTILQDAPKSIQSVTEKGRFLLPLLFMHMHMKVILLDNNIYVLKLIWNIYL